jgi:hypothetical protein
MNDFYKLHKLFQWPVALLLLVIGFTPLLTLIEIGHKEPLFYLVFILYVPLAQFTFTPFFKLIGVYRYYSPMLLGYMANDKQIDLHNGTTFDYLWVMRKVKPGIEMRNRVLMYQLEGMQNIIQQIESNIIPQTVTIIGTSYFFSNRTLKKLGFEIVKPSLFYRLNILVNFIDLTCLYSLSKGRFTIPNLLSVKKASISGKKIVENKKNIEEILMILNKKHTKTINLR